MLENLEICPIFEASPPMQISLVGPVLTHSIASLSLLCWSSESTLTGNNLPVVPGRRGPWRQRCGLNLSPCLTFPLYLARSLSF